MFKTIIAIICGVFLCMQTGVFASSRIPKVVLDPGHGGYDYGAVYGGVKEKDLNLDIAKRIRNLLEDRRVKVYMTRSTDKTVGLYSRSTLANRIDADIFVSIHNNSGSRGEKGTMALYYPGTDETRRGYTGKDIASLAERELTSVLGSRNDGLEARPRLAVLRTTRMPAIIAEIGYMSNRSDLARLKTSAYKEKAALAVEKTILKVLGI